MESPINNMSHLNPSHDRDNEYPEDRAKYGQKADLLKHIGGKVGKSAEKAKKMAGKVDWKEVARANKGGLGRRYYDFKKKLTE